MNYELHPLCTLFPRMVGKEFEALVSDIRDNGQREPIILHEGMILDGGNRYRACVEAGVNPQFMQFGGGNLVAYVLSANLHRRHMSAGQQAAIVASAQDWGKAHSHGGDRKSDQVVTLPLDTAKGRAAASGASEKTQRNADKVAKADPELAKKVAHGEISLPAAIKKISPPEPEDFGPSEEEIAAAETERAANEESLRRLLESDDKLAAAYAEIKRLNAELAVVKSSRDGYMNQCAEWQRKYRALDRKMSKAA